MNEKITNFLEKLETHLKNKSEAINFRDLEIPYVAKGLRDSVADAVIFGGTVEQYQFWRPHVCAVCCVKMVGDAAGKTNNMTMNMLTDICLKEGVFRVGQEKRVLGAFHHPLVRVMNKLGVPAKVAGDIKTKDIIREIKVGKIVFLSVDLAKLYNNPSNESHLVVVYDVVDGPNAEFRLHDCSSVLSSNGNAMFISEEELSRLSNKKGLIVG